MMYLSHVMLLETREWTWAFVSHQSGEHDSRGLMVPV